MSFKRIIYALGLALIIGLLAWGATLIHAPQAQETHLLAGTATTTESGPALEYREDHQYYTVDIVYPETRNQKMQMAIETALKSELDDYMQNVAGIDASMMPSLGEGDYKLALDIEFQKFTGAGKTTSYLFTVYEDTGGAHPNHYYRTFVFNQAGTELGLGDLFVSTSTNPHADYLNQIAGIATVNVEDQMRQRLGDDPSGALFTDGLAPMAENFQNFVLDGSMLKLFFPPYQVAAYAMGDFEVDIPLSKFGDILRPEFK